MKNIRLYAILFIGMILLGSCENLFIKDLEIEDIDFEKQVVINAEITSITDTMAVFVSENNSILETIDDIVFIDDAEVELLFEGQKIADFYLGDDKRYYHVFNEGERLPGNYTLNINTPKYGMAVAETQIPEEVNPVEIEFIEDAGTDPFNQVQTSAVRIKIQDPPGKNFYSFKVDFLEETLVSDTFISGIDTFINQYRPFVDNNLADPNVSFLYNGEIILPDATFDGRDYIILLRFTVDSREGFDIKSVLPDLRLYWKVVSEDYYLYQTSLTRYFNSGFGIFAEPIGVHTNIDNGLGIFSGQNIQVIPIE